MKKKTKKNSFEDVILNLLEDIEFIIKKNGKSFFDIFVDDTTQKIDRIILKNKLILKGKLKKKHNESEETKNGIA